MRQNLLPPDEAEQAEIKVIANEVCEFQTERFTIQVTNDRFAALSKPSANPAPLRDLVAGTFFVLEHTPLTALGLNREMHYAMPTEEVWNRVGDTLVPKDIWRNVLHGRIGMRALVIEAGIPGDSEEKQLERKLTIRVEPSNYIKHGVFRQTNEHYNAPEKEGAGESLTECLRNRWEGAYNYAAEIAIHVLDSIAE